MGEVPHDLRAAPTEPPRVSLEARLLESGSVNWGVVTVVVGFVFGGWNLHKDTLAGALAG